MSDHMEPVVSKEDAVTRLPLLPLRGISVFPQMLLNFEVERPQSISALRTAAASDRLIFLVTQKEISTECPGEDDLFRIGTICRIKQTLKTQIGNAAVRVLVEGVSRARLLRVENKGEFFLADVQPLEDIQSRRTSVRTEALIRTACGLFDEYANLSAHVKPEIIIGVIAREEPGYVADYIAQNVFLRHTLKQLLLEELRPVKRLELLCNMLRREVNVLMTEKQLQESTQEQMAKSQKDYYLREQLKVIQSELGEYDDGPSDYDEYRDQIQALHFPQEIEDKLMREVTRLAKQPFGSAEAAVLRNYLDVVLDLPWLIRSRETLDVSRAAAILDQDHYGLTKVKERILEFLSVKQLAPDLKGTVLCLVGPPGTGKTSIAMSVARATGRKLARISLGGVHDEAEIRGHRKTYVGAMPGRIIAGLQQAGTMNPVMVLDEIDKLGGDFRGDPSAALLEALDGEQNSAFRDHFLEIPVDLSDVLFITTANTLDTIPRPLLDRMEVIELSSYTDEEKLHIAKEHLLPKQRRKHGLKGGQLRLSDDAIREIITLYTRESGVRVLERQIAAVCRKTARGIAAGEYKSIHVRAGKLEELLGPAKYKPEAPRYRDEAGLVRGLAWTSVGGEILDVEVNVVEGSGKLELTGNLGDVMKESAHAAMSYVRSRARKLGIDPEFYKNRDIHIHFPEGAVPKDGPSAGITIAIGLISALTGTPVHHEVAMTGEITLRGRILPIGGLREKTMAALRNGIQTVIIPEGNAADLEEIDPDVRRALNFVTTDHLDKILDVALCRPMPRAELPVPEDNTLLPRPELAGNTGTDTGSGGKPVIRQ